MAVAVFIDEIADGKMMILLSIATGLTAFGLASPDKAFGASFIPLDEATKPVIKKGDDVLSDAPMAGDTLTASSDATGVTYKWFYAGESGNPTGAEIASEASYTVKEADAEISSLLRRPSRQMQMEKVLLQRL